MSTGTIYMIPCPIVEGQMETIPEDTLSTIRNLKYFVVERAKTARRFIKLTDHPLPIQELEIFELDKNNPESGLYSFLKETTKGHSVGILSEAGCPGIADPGALAVSWAHENNILVSPLTGPSSILLALIASGMSGQQFTFHGYLPVKKPELVQTLRKLEQAVHRSNQTQIFMETPYRNHAMIETILKSLSPNLKLCIAANISGSDQQIKTRTIKQWKNEEVDVHKIPVIYLLGR